MRGNPLRQRRIMASPLARGVDEIPPIWPMPATKSISCKNIRRRPTHPFQHRAMISPNLRGMAMVENKIAVDRNHAALKHILASLVAMAGWTATGGTFLRTCSDAGSATTLPRHLYVAILRLLRPAEAATRRLVIVLARGISVTLPPLRAAKPKPGPVLLKDGKGTGIVDTGISLYRLGLANVLPPIAPTRSFSNPPHRLPPARPLAQSIPPPPPPQLEAEHRRSPLPARPHRAACHSGAAPIAPRSDRRHASWSAPCRPRLGAGRHAGPGSPLRALARPPRQDARAANFSR